MKFPLSLIPHGTKIDFMSMRRYSFPFSFLLTLAVIIFFLAKGLNLGIDFTGGIILEARFKDAVNVHEVREELGKLNYHGASIQSFGSDRDIIIRLQPKNSEEQGQEVAAIKAALQAFKPDIEFRKIDYVGPKVGEELVYKGVLALVCAMVGILIYMGIRFNWYFGLGAIIALFHDAIATVGFYIFSDFEFDLSSIAAILTIVGYSINDTVVIYDRIRENLRKYKVTNLADILNQSINETLSRTVMTVMTVLLVCVALIVFGGDVLKGFSSAIFFGVAFGTYCSIFIATPILLHIAAKEIARSGTSN